MQLHDQALVHYRDQQLDNAIGLWQQVTDLDPGFEPARVYPRNAPRASQGKAGRTRLKYRLVR